MASFGKSRAGCVASSRLPGMLLRDQCSEAIRFLRVPAAHARLKIRLSRNDVRSVDQKSASLFEEGMIS
jgi:hypothetical protein